MPIIKSILDTDFYKFSMQSSALFGNQFGISYQDCDAEYQFINRANTEFPNDFAPVLQDAVNAMADLQLTKDEYDWLRENCPFLKRAYLDYLKGYRFDPSEVEISYSPDLQISIKGPWYSAILWEVPLMALISELYFKSEQPDAEYLSRMYDKASAIKEAKLVVADFGTRRRFSQSIQQQLVHTFHTQAGPTFVGTSNVALAMKHNIKPIGTHAHEYFSFHAALFGYRLANHLSLKAWSDEYKGDLGIALSDTFTTDVFLRDFSSLFAKQFDGVRQDSHCAFEFLEKMINHYKKLGIDPMSKTIIFSDALDIPKAIKIKEACEGRIKCAFGIGTNLTADCGHNPLNMVIKLTGVNYQGRYHPAIKLSDAPGKETGNSKEIARCKQILDIR